MKKVLIRVDASPEIGLGHAVRCIALANILKNNFSICFSSIHIPITLINEIESAGFTFNKINNENDFYESINKNDIVVIDHYGIDSSWQRKIKSKTCKLVCIDDIHDKFFYADLIINHAPGISANNYLTQAQTMFALGTEYALLRPAFLKLSDNKRKINNLNTVFVCFGGSDYYNLSERTINILLI
jgi:UDP-2,4-diacetamido-2,4,6-trideoxy-beta-L-altropyranose hydrolase